MDKPTQKQLDAIRAIADYQNMILNETGRESDHWISFDDGHGTAIHDPFTDSSGRFEVDPVAEYGDAFLKSDFIKETQGL